MRKWNQLPKMHICDRHKAEGVLRDKGGRIFSCKFTKKDGTPRVMIAKLAKNAEFDRKHPHMLVHDMENGGEFRKINLKTLHWIADKNEEVYFHG